MYKLPACIYKLKLLLLIIGKPATSRLSEGIPFYSLKYIRVLGVIYFNCDYMKVLEFATPSLCLYHLLKPIKYFHLSVSKSLSSDGNHRFLIVPLYNNFVFTALYNVPLISSNFSSFIPIFNFLLKYMVGL